LNQLVALFKEKEMAELLLDSIEFPEHFRPIFPNQGKNFGYWQEICRQIQNGVLPAGNDLQPLIDAAVSIYPANPVFQQYCSKNRTN
jgi:hypothetical protein